MEILSLVFGVIGNVISVLMFLSPVGTFWRIIKHKSTEDFESLPYICTLLNAALWTYYGIIKPGAFLVATVNGFGILVEIVYVTLFLVYAAPKMRAKTGILVGLLDVGFLAAAILVTRLVLQGQVRIDATGFMCCGLNIVMYGSPLAAMVPNGAGFLLGAAQLVLYAIYRNANPSSNVSDGLEEGWQYQTLISSAASSSSEQSHEIKERN
ncbi:bidirectional sugar transporter SWEET17 isoform X3 [Hevea brasiliensis]|uniref:bidirectional sugar transporter SWEET17 isoform X3 n=1 Tax=Hevea brasiliensis TaxID=3981 RepID=UPI0025E0D47F|nr:bidirectional sugar transporter SWEET17 isoform X3 [Hevea brasiliensis]